MVPVDRRGVPVDHQGLTVIGRIVRRDRNALAEQHGLVSLRHRLFVDRIEDVRSHGQAVGPQARQARQVDQVSLGVDASQLVRCDRDRRPARRAADRDVGQREARVIDRRVELELELVEGMSGTALGDHRGHAEPLGQQGARLKGEQATRVDVASCAGECPIPAGSRPPPLDCPTSTPFAHVGLNSRLTSYISRDQDGPSRRAASPAVPVGTCIRAMCRRGTKKARGALDAPRAHLTVWDRPSRAIPSL